MERRLYVVTCSDDEMPVYVCEADCQSEALNMAAIAHDMDFDDYAENHYVSHSQAWDPTKFKTMSESKKEKGE
jgi:hypothetical protein